MSLLPERSTPKQGPSIVSVEEPLRVDVSGATTYYGYATIGTTDGESKWKIKKEEVSGTETIRTFADGNGYYDNVWNDRATLDYN